ncbi:MFS transporter [Streptomyces poonensis]|uniref:MFS transporter n=1 Tax=Streptomyces poonensis TaxID=68255 RepID=A0A918PDT0_9ACTN|nr:MFS transporter [Streptomyces poonensis]GGZ02370.1 MFS transporter [Streptomyces poonensis]GLJ93243.1 MFS transporter [Streptomyces poonensis]
MLGAVLVALDGTVLTIAQPALRHDLHASFAQVQWTGTGYLIAVASLLVFAGRLGDRYGHQRMFALGMLGFGAASAGLWAAPGVGWVIGLRVVQGVFGALLQPATLGMLRAAFPPDRLGMPVALRTSAIGLAVAAGPLVGGVLVIHFGWRSVFLLNVVPALVLGVLALLVRAPAPDVPDPDVPDPDVPHPYVPAGQRTSAVARLDLPGALLLATALICLVHTLVGVPERGWTLDGMAGLLAAAAAAGAFVRHERRTADPLLPPDVFGPVAVRAALGLLVTASAAMLGTMFVGSHVLQDVLGLDPLRTSLTALPGAVAMVLGAPASAVLMRRRGARETTFLGTGLLTLGVLVLSRVDGGTATAVISGGFLLLGAGFGAVMVTATAVLVRQAPVASAGVTGGLQQTALNVGPALGTAAATTVLTLSDGTGTAPALTVLACAAALGGLFCVRLPGADGRSPGTGARCAGDIEGE